jgi:ABC-type branched-subunit amino acid transport system substrate-binding protein
MAYKEFIWYKFIVDRSEGPATTAKMRYPQGGILKRKLVVTALAGLLSATTGLVGMGGFAASASASSNPIIVGEISGNTGAYASVGQAAFNSVKMAAAAINASGGILGRQVKVLYGNDGASATTSALLFKKFVSEGAVAILGSLDTGPTTVAVSNSMKFPDVGNIDEGGVYPNGPTKAPYPWAWSTSMNGYGVGEVIGNYAMKHCSTGLYIMHDPTAYGSTGNTGILTTYTKKPLGDDAITENWSSSSPAAATMDAELTKIKASGADCVETWLTAQDQATFVNEMHSLGDSFTIIGNDTTNSTGVFANLAGANANGVLAEELGILAQAPSPALTKYTAAYVKEFKIQPIIWGMVSYDGLMVLAQAIKNGKSTSKNSIRTQLNELKNYHGLTGNLGFTKMIHTSINGPQFDMVRYSTSTQKWSVVK